MQAIEWTRVKSLKTKRSEPKSEIKNWPGGPRAKVLYFVSGRAGPGSVRNFNFSFVPGRKFFFFTSDRAEIAAMRAAPAGPCRPQACTQRAFFEHVFILMDLEFPSYEHSAQSVSPSSTPKKRSPGEDVQKMNF